MVFTWAKISDVIHMRYFQGFLFLRKVEMHQFTLKMLSLLKPGQYEVQYFHSIKLHIYKSHHC